MEFGILGPLEVTDGGRRCLLQSGRQRLILAFLVLHANRVVSSERVIDALWGESPPSSARATLRTHVAQLRKALGPNGVAVVATEPPGYALRVHPEQVDALRFQRLAREGHDLLPSDPAGAAERLWQALSLWRGAPLGDIGDEPFAQGDVARLIEHRWNATEDRAEAELALGHHAEVVSELEALVTEQPLRERLWEYLMVALYRSGRQAEALRAFQTARRRLAEELGVDPSPRLRQLEDQVLRHDRVLEVPASRPTALGGSRHLPVGVVTVLLTDVEGSTQGWRELGDGVVTALQAINTTVARAVEAHGGVFLKARGEGDSTFSVFERPANAVAAALELQRMLVREGGATPVPLRVRVAVHSGEARLDDGDYVGIEIARAARLRDAAHGGQVILSAATADLAAEALPPGASVVALGAPRLKDFDRPQPIFQLVHPDLPSSFPPLRASAAFADVPIPLTRLIGRERELAEIGSLLDDTRLVTVTGTGGCGKTRLALEVARKAAGRFRDGVVIVELASVADPAFVLPTVAASLGVRDGSGRNLEDQLRARARSLNVLLLMDNCEHVLLACAQLAAGLLHAAPETVMLATSRQRLGLPGETAYPVAPLPTPPHEHATPEAVASWPAVELFISRARALDPSFRLSTENAPLVGHICRRIDGLPLAIELAAVAVRAVGMDEISRAVEHRIDAIAPGDEFRPSRHQTLRALIGWSYDLLSEPERALFSQLSVLSGGFDLATAHTVCADAGVDRESTVAGVARLVERSLVVPDQSRSGARYQMLNTIRAYADETLTEQQRYATRARQLAWALDFVTDADAQLRRAEAGPALAVLERELDNLRGAIEWGLSEGDSSGAVRLTNVLARFWAMRGRITEGRQWLERARPRLDDVPPMIVGRWYLASGALACVAGELHAARDLLDRAVEVLQECGERSGAAEALFALAQLDRMSGNHRGAESMYDQGLKLAEALGDAHNIAAGKAGLGDAACARGDHERGRQLYEEALASFRQAGGEHAIANALLNLATANRGLGRYDAADRYCREAEAIFRGLEDRSCTAATLESMAELAIAAGDARRGATLYAESLQLRVALEQRAPLAVPLEGLAIDLVARRQWVDAVTVLAAADALRGDEFARAPASQDRYAEALGAAREGLDVEAFDAAWNAGRQQELGEIVALAQRHAPP